jgi:hypothetical protein
MIMSAMLRKLPLLALVVVPGLALPQMAVAQSNQTRSSTNLPIVYQGKGTVGAGAYAGIAPDISSTNGIANGVTDNANGVIDRGLATQVEAANPYGVYSYDEDVSYTQANGQRALARREGTQERIGRYYGSAYSNGDLAPAAYTDDEYSATRGKTTMKSRRLGVFDTNGGDKRSLSIRPYIEATQVVQGIISPDRDLLTYSVLAVGADATINGRNNQGQISARYERRFGWNRKSDGDGITGIARLSSAIVPNALRLDYGAYANRTYISTTGAAVSTGAVTSDSLTQIYSVYAGPTLAVAVGDVAVTGHYHAGYTSVGPTTTLITPAARIQTNTLDHATVQDAKLAVGTRPGDVLPIGLGADASFYQEDVSNLSQRVMDKHVRGEVTIPVADDLALVGGIGYEHVTVSSRDAVYDSAGNVVRDAKGRLLTDYSQPRQIAFDSSGLIWDGGVVWRPSRRTNLEFHIGRRYGEVGAYGFFNFMPDDHSSFNIAVYDGVTGFGGSLTNSLFNLATQFTTMRDAITGNLSSCVSSLSGGNCLGSAISSVNSTIYRGRGFSAGYSFDFRRVRAGFGAGYDRRRYITAPNTVLANLNGKLDQYYWLAAYFGYQLTPHSNFETRLDAYKYQSGWNSTGDMNAIRAIALYRHNLTRHLTANASLAIDGVTRQQVDDLWSTAGALGMRYTF